MGEDREKRVRIAGAEAIGHLGEGEAAAEESVFELGVVQAIESVEDFLNFAHASSNDVSGERDVSYRGTEQLKAAVGGARNPAVKGVKNG